MNIFYLDHNPQTCAIYHADKHVVKMILEYSQLLSTAHRVLDGRQGIDTVNGRHYKRWIMEEPVNSLLYKSTHVNHPSAIWCRDSAENYIWLSSLLVEVCKEYTYRYGKVHKAEEDGIVEWLVNNVPKKISNKPFTEPTPAMPDEYKDPKDSVDSYRTYYICEKYYLFSWTKRETPPWIKEILFPYFRERKFST